MKKTYLLIKNVSNIARVKMTLEQENLGFLIYYLWDYKLIT